MLNIKEKVEEIVEKLKNDKDLMAKFQKDPVGLLEEYIGIDLPNDQIEQVVDMIKAKINLDKIGGALGGLFGKR